MASNKKKYGLILASARRDEELRSASGGGGVRKINILRTSDDELEEDDHHQKEESQLSRGEKHGKGNSAQQAQQLRLMREALEEDPSIFMYDEHYDDQKAKQSAVEAKKQQNSEPKYIGRILQSAQRRQLERERCTVRKLQKERDAEQGFFDDKESFVTPAYVKKLEEIRQAEAREQMMEVIEEKNDAMRDLSTCLFYKEIFNQRLGGDAAAVDPGPVDATTRNNSSGETDHLHHKGSEQDHEAESISRKRIRSSSSPGSKGMKRRPKDMEPDRVDAENSNSGRANSSYGVKKSDMSSKACSDGSHTSNRDSERSNREFRKSDRDSKILTGNRNADSSRSISESKEHRHKSKDQYNEGNTDQLERSAHRSSSKYNKSDKREAKSPSQRDRVSIKKEIPSSPESTTESPSKSKDAKEKSESKEDRVARLFAKRTIGDKFIEAQQRYLQRKADRSSRGGL